MTKKPESQLWSETTTELQQTRFEYIERRWRQLTEHSNARVDAAINYLMLTNAGGAVATLSFMGAMQTVSPVPGAPIMLGLFLAGICLVGILRLMHSYRVMRVYASWRQDVEQYLRDNMSWSALIGRDEARTKTSILPHLLGFLSFACFVAGAVIGYKGTFAF